MKAKISHLKQIIKEELEKFMKEEGIVSEQDETAANELQLYIENDVDLYRQQKSIQKNLVTKMARGEYQTDKAIKLWMYLVDNGAKKYAMEHGGGGAVGPSVGGFDKQTRLMVAKNLASSFEEEAKLGNYDNLLPQKYQKEEISEEREDVQTINKLNKMMDNVRELTSQVDILLSRGSYNSARADLNKLYKVFIPHMIEIVDILVGKEEELRENDGKIEEKSLSKSQQQAMGAAYAAKKGDIPVEKLKGPSKEMYKSMSAEKLKDFAATKHKGLPQKKEK